MKNLTIFAFLILIFGAISCSNDDDVCLSGEATPRMKLKFKDFTTNKIKTLDSLFVDVDYGSGRVNVIDRKIKTDSVFIPIRVDENGSTDIYIATTKKGTYSKIKFSYSIKSQYVSPACGFKRLYESVSGSLVTATPVKKLEQNQTQIIDENKTHFYLHF